MLSAWLAGEDVKAPWSNYPPTINIAYADWLRKASPDEWHGVALGHNWSYSEAPLFFISRHRDCDLATALYIFYAAEPSTMARRGFDPRRVSSTSEHRSLRLMLGIRDRVLNGFYKHSAIAFDPVRTFGSRWRSVDLGPDFHDMLDGRQPKPLPMDDGYPLEVWAVAEGSF